MHHKGNEPKCKMQTCMLSIIHVYILPSLPTIKQSNNQRKCKQAFKGTSVKKKQKTLFNWNQTYR